MSENRLYCKDCKHCGAIPDFDGDWNVRICNLKNRNVQSNSPMTCDDYVPKPPKKHVIDKESKIITIASSDDMEPKYISLISWEQRRFELVKSLATAYFSNQGAAHSGAVEYIIKIADEIIEKLKENNPEMK